MNRSLTHTKLNANRYCLLLYLCVSCILVELLIYHTNDNKLLADAQQHACDCATAHWTTGANTGSPAPGADYAPGDWYTATGNQYSRI